ncbi:hypothetical protein SAMN04487947_0107 [Halogeometricum rufum]|jgi:hypothetical protein|uniref:Pyridoxamine 5'-phosphate oxidase n=2 Tax=Halogeometricum TaxID=60846 RepID=A0A1I6FW07_9EURY|nr:pyridoxamine 5'-phosphate oxidase family protein [Halogeometricum rufum]SFR34088.1 hypothetical protein SAMN04487947_0107 [Halogeometricum rufum]
MEEFRWTRLTDDEVDAFLGDGGTGTISFATDAGDPPFTLPVSYGYDEASGSLYFRLAFPPGTGKDDVVENPLSFVVHDRTGDGWQSVVAAGELEELSDLPYESSAVQAMWAVSIPKVDIFDVPPGDITFRYFRLVPDELSGRKAVGDEFDD